MDQPCTVGKDFNPKTCRYIQSCKPGYSRNKDFKCVKDLTAPPRSVGKEKIGLLKGLFSNQSTNANSNRVISLTKSKKSPKSKKTTNLVLNGLVNSPPTAPRRKSKHITKTRLVSNGLVNSPPTSPRTKSKHITKYPRLVFNENGNEIPPLEKNPNIQSEYSKNLRMESMKEILKGINLKQKGKDGKELTWGQMKDIARSKGLKLESRNDKLLYKSLIGNYLTGNRTPKTKKVAFKLNTNEPPKSQKASQKASKNSSQKSKGKGFTHSNINSLMKSNWATTKKPIKPIKKFRSKTMSASTDANSKSKPESKPESKSKPKPSKKFLSKQSMTHRDALQIMEVKDDYTMNDLARQYKKLSSQIHPDKTFDEKKTTVEFKGMNRAFEILKQKFVDPEINKSISFPSDEIILNLDKMTGLYTPETVFKFYSKSSDRSPGKGAGEKIKVGDEEKYIPLSQIFNWRKMLSNFYIEPFELEGKRWQSVEHYYQASKFKDSPDFYNEFSLDSGSELSKNPLMAKAAGGKSGIFQGRRIRPSGIKIDDDFFPDRSKIEMYKAQHAKFTQNDALSAMLKLTFDAKLLHHVRGSAPVVFDNLMYIRSKL